MLIDLIKKLAESLDSKSAKVCLSDDCQPSREIIALVNRLVVEAEALGTAFDVKHTQIDAGRSIIELTSQEQVDVVLAASVALVCSFGNSFRFLMVGSGKGFRIRSALKSVLRALLRKPLPFNETQLVELMSLVSSDGNAFPWEMPIAEYCQQIERFVGTSVPSQALKRSVEKVIQVFAECANRPGSRKSQARVENLLQKCWPNAIDATTRLEIRTGEMWTERLSKLVEGLEFSPRRNWEDLLVFCQTATSARPSAKWLKEASRRVDALGRTQFDEFVTSTLSQVGKSGATEARYYQWPNHELTYPTEPTMVHDKQSNLLRGLIWVAGTSTADSVGQALGDAAVTCFKKIPYIGPRSPKIGNACLVALANGTNPSWVAQLSRLKTKAKHASVRTQVSKALNAASEKAGISPAELEEIGVPDFGMTEVGKLRRPIGDFTLHADIVDSQRVDVSWEKPGGGMQKSVPAAVKNEFADDLKAVKRLIKEIETTLPAQRDRIERLFLQQPSWSFRDFRARYLDHPLVATLARRLIWQFEAGDRKSSGMWREGSIVDVESRQLSFLTDESRVQMWHPLFHEPAQVLAWRERLERNEIVQPFKQAHREIYVLTDAERTTETYSNRFASHIVRQHQIAALCHERGWRYTLQGNWDSHNIPQISLPELGLRVEFWVEPMTAAIGDAATTGVFLHVATDQVRFYQEGSRDPMRLADVPPLVFSEMMRDIHLFVGVSSVGNDPSWQDGGPDGAHRAYWQGFAFGELSGSSETRRDVLQSLIPRLKIANRCTIESKFLVVRGDIRTYKIHLGSGNILMSPNDQYLCIVPDGSKDKGSGTVFLPFEGDRVLSIILSKAFMLAEDKKIKDPTIVRQIK